MDEPPAVVVSCVVVVIPPVPLGFSGFDVSVVVVVLPEGGAV